MVRSAETVAAGEAKNRMLSDLFGLLKGLDLILKGLMIFP